MQTGTVAEVVARAMATLNRSTDTPALDARVLLGHVCDLSAASIAANPDLHLTHLQLANMDAAVARRHQGEPVAYILGHKEFWSLDLLVTPDTLIPRPETELLVERALERIPLGAAWTIADLGTGCGAVALAVANERPLCRVIATDMSNRAIELARVNADRAGIVNVEFRTGDWCAPIREAAPALVMANPPYVTARDPHLDQSGVCFEPKQALVGGPDGLECIRHIISDARVVLKTAGWLLLEHGFDQSRSVQHLMQAQGYQKPVCHRDCNGQPRVTECQLP